VQKIDLIVWAISIALTQLTIWPFGKHFAEVARRFGALARRKRLAIVAVGVATIVLRLAMLPWMPVPEPWVQDEFSYLLAADTFVRGRLANPTHPMWAFFDTFHVLQHPTYASIYAPAQGAVLALGKLLGEPWIGVLLSTAVMCMAITWALQGWVPAEWALLGGILVMCRLGLFGYWMNSYWGGSVPAAGGALVIGALPRIFRENRPRDAAICGIGAGILANSRPFEGFVFCLPIAVSILWWWLCGAAKERRTRLRQAILPLAVALAIPVGFLAYYNARVTGSATMFPEMVEARNKVVAPIFVWQHAKPQRAYANQQFEDFYNQEAQVFHVPAWKKGAIFWAFFVGPALTVGLLAVFWLFPDPVVRLLMVQFALSGLGLCMVTYFFPHYAAPLVATLMVLVTLGLYELRQFRLVVGVAVVFGILSGPISVGSTTYLSSDPFRRATERQLEAQPGDHLVLVSYGERHDPSSEYTYNAADIDRARIVWARLVPGQNLTPLLSYFRNRDVWVFRPDDDRTLERYRPAPRGTEHESRRQLLLGAAR
jgi:hypothetical protein